MKPKPLKFMKITTLGNCQTRIIAFLMNMLSSDALPINAKWVCPFKATEKYRDTAILVANDRLKLKKSAESFLIWDINEGKKFIYESDIVIHQVLKDHPNHLVTKKSLSTMIKNDCKMISMSSIRWHPDYPELSEGMKTRDIQNKVDIHVADIIEKHLDCITVDKKTNTIGMHHGIFLYLEIVKLICQKTNIPYFNAETESALMQMKIFGRV